MNVELLLKVKQAILDEPARLNMDNFLKSSDYYHDQEPACGTVGCIAGWAVIIDALGRDLSPQSIKKARLSIYEGDVEKKACKLLGLEYTGLHPLFYPWGAWPEDLDSRLRAEKPGTLAYAQVVVEAIDRYIAHPWGDPCNGK
jgi:hypothetical protein